MKKLNIVLGTVIALTLGFGQSAFAMTNLVLTGTCTIDPSTTLNWSVDNTGNGFAVPYTWDRQGLESGSSTAQASSTDTFSTGTIASSTAPDVVTITYFDVTASSTVSTSTPANTSACPLPPPPAPSSAPVAPQGGIGGRRHTMAQMIAEGLFAPGTVLSGQVTGVTPTSVVEIYTQLIALLQQELVLANNQ